MARGRMVTSSGRPPSSTACRASRRFPAPPRLYTPSPAHVRRSPSRFRSGSRLKSEHLRILRREALGPYTLLRLERGGLEPGSPGQFFMLEPPGRLLPRPMSLCLAPEGEIGVLGPLGNGFRLDVEQPLLVGGGIGVAPFPYLSDVLGAPRALLGFRSAWHAEAAALVPNAKVVLEPTYATELMPPGYDVLACGPEAMLEAVRGLAPDAQLAWEAPMAGGFGACYGCVVEIAGQLKRLCIEGPVLGTTARAASLAREVAR